jgi:LysM repeat protein
MCDTRQDGLRIRRRRPWWAILMTLGLGWPTLAAAGSQGSATPKTETAVEIGAGREREEDATGAAKASARVEPEKAAKAGKGKGSAKAKAPEVGASEAEGVDEVETAEGAGPLPVTAGDRPTRAPAHADCGFRMPLYEHTVERGEHLGIIAGRYGVRYGELVELNPQLTNPDLIRPGQTIRVCPEIFPRIVQRIEHEVRPGETLGGIAQAHGLSLEALLDQQDGGITDANHVRAGQRLVLYVDGGLVPEFLPPEPGSPRAKKAGGGRGKIATALTPSEHVLIRRPRAAYGTTKTIDLVQSAVARYRRAHAGAPKVVIGDISRKGGGQFYPHASHRTGRDIDLGYVVRGKGHERVGKHSYAKIDVARTWALIEAFIDTKQVVYVFVDYRLQEKLYEHARAQGVPQRELDGLFQYPHGRGRAHGIIRHWPNHRHHFHVRFRS